MSLSDNCLSAVLVSNLGQRAEDRERTDTQAWQTSTHRRKYSATQFKGSMQRSEIYSAVQCKAPDVMHCTVCTDTKEW